MSALLLAALPSSADPRIVATLALLTAATMAWLIVRPSPIPGSRARAAGPPRPDAPAEHRRK